MKISRTQGDYLSTCYAIRSSIDKEKKKLHFTIQNKPADFGTVIVSSQKRAERCMSGWGWVGGVKAIFESLWQDPPHLKPIPPHTEAGLKQTYHLRGLTGTANLRLEEKDPQSWSGDATRLRFTFSLTGLSAATTYCFRVASSERVAHTTVGSLQCGYTAAEDRGRGNTQRGRSERKSLHQKGLPWFKSFWVKAGRDRSFTDTEVSQQTWRDRFSRLCVCVYVCEVKRWQKAVGLKKQKQCWF